MSGRSPATLARRTVFVLLGVLMLLPLGTSATEFREAATPYSFAEPPGVNLEMATAIVRTKTGGRVLSANPASKGKLRGYKVRVLVEDRVVETWFVDSRGRASSE